MDEWAGIGITVAVLGLAASMVCQIIRDYRRGDYRWAAFGAACVIALVAMSLVPVQTNAVMLEMPS